MKQAQDISPILNEGETGSLLYNSGFQASSIYHNSKVYLADCMDLLRQTPDKYYCLACVDPPYGINIMSAGGTPEHLGFKQYTKKDWDNKTPNAEYFKELFRVSINQVVWGGNYFTEYLPPSMGWILWDKGQRISQSDGELAFTSYQKALRVFTLNRCSIKMEGAIHPTQKPIALYDWIYKNYLPQGGKVIDTHLGSGSNRIAANKAGNIDFVGFELDKDYYEAQEKRWKGFIAQTRLF